MEALIYDESPIAEYLEADALPFQPADSPSSPACTPTFAPRGLPKLRERLRTLRRTAASVTDVANDHFLERFRYTIVASQLLSDAPGPRRHHRDDQPLDKDTFSVKGSCITAGISFSIAWFLHLLQRRYRLPQPSHWSEICTYTCILFGGCLLLFFFFRRQYLEFVRRSAGLTLGKVVLNSHDYDRIAAEGLRFVQEVEVVSRGYEM